MTLRELMERTFWDSGEPSDLCPYATPGDETTFDSTLPGALKLIRYLNNAQLRIANWKFRDGRILRFRSLRGRVYFASGDPITGTVTSATARSLVIDTLGSDVADQFNGWLVAIVSGSGSGQIRLITDTTVVVPVTLTIDSDWDTIPDATSVYELYKGFFRFVSAATYPYQAYHILLDPIASLVDVMRVRDVSASVDLGRTYYNDMFTASVKTTGIPSTYQVFGNELWFDAAPTENRSYEMLYIKNPAALVNATDVPEIPESYQEAISLWVTHNIMRMNQDFDGSYATKRELEDLMQMLRLSGEFEMELDAGGIVVWG